jgi:ParB-like chromosome segregation protein Spo0J
MERTKAPHVQALADSIKEVGLLHYPMLRQSDLRVIHGEDRIAAHYLSEIIDVPCTLVECSDEELLTIRKHENAHRRDESAAELLARVEAAEKELALMTNFDAFKEPDPALDVIDALAPDAVSAIEDAPPMTTEQRSTHERELARALQTLTEPAAEPRKAGRPKTRRGKALEQIAAEVGRTPNAVRKATEREAKKRELNVIELWGRAQPPAWLEPVLEARAGFTDAAAKVQAAMAALTRLGSASQLREGVLGAQHGALKEVGQQLRLARPAALCAWCKNLPGVVGGCAACRGLGYLTEEELGQVPDKLKDPRVVMVEGRATRVEESPVSTSAFSAAAESEFDTSVDMEGLFE